MRESHRIKVSVMYPNRRYNTFDTKYYYDHHIPMVRQLKSEALKRLTIDEGIAGAEPGSRAPYRILAHLFFDSLLAFQTTFAAHAQAIISDIPNTQYSADHSG